MKKIISTVFMVFAFVYSYAIWQPLGSGLGGRVYALAVHNGELYAGGNFTGLISKWDGVSWANVGGGLTGTSVRSLISFNGELYAGGMFTVAGTSGNITKWDGSSWTAVGDGLGGIAGSGVMCLHDWNGVLYAGGTFNQSGTSALSKIGKLVNASWVQVGGGAPTNCLAGVYAIEDYNNELYVGGQGSAPWINKLNLTGTQWDNLPPAGPNVGNGVYALSTFKFPNQFTNSLFVGGSFSAPIGTCCVYSNATWGTPLNIFSSGAGDRVNAFLSTSDYIYAGGIFTVTGFAPAINIAKKKTSIPWDTLNVVLNDGVDAFAIYQGYLVCGGNFTTANGITVNHVMINDGIFVSSENHDKADEPYYFPNPAHSTIRFSSKAISGNPLLQIYDADGKKVFEDQIQRESDIDLSHLKRGTFIYQLSENGRKLSAGKILLY